MPDEVGAFVWFQQIEEAPESAPKGVDGADGARAQQALELGECHFDRVEIGAIGGQEQQSRFGTLDQLAHASNLVRGQIVHDDDVARSERRDQHLLDKRQEQLTVDGTVEYGACRDAVATQRGDDGAGLPVPMRNGRDQALAARRSTAQPGHVGFDPSLINKNQSMLAPLWLLLVPSATSLGDVRSVLLGRAQDFFYMSAVAPPMSCTAGPGWPSRRAFRSATRATPRASRPA